MTREIPHPFNLAVENKYLKQRLNMVDTKGCLRNLALRQKGLHITRRRCGRRR